MHFSPNEIYHVYNRGNNKQIIFFEEKNYIFFLNKIRQEWRKYCDILSYCLMPNHFHFMIIPNEAACENLFLGDKLTDMQNLSKTIGKTLSSYTKAINIQNNTTGNLFQKKTKSKCISGLEDKENNFKSLDYVLTCFYYIHQNPIQAKLVQKLKEWKYSSYPDYYGYRNGTLCNKKLAMELLGLSHLDFDNDDNGLDQRIVDGLF